MKKTISFALSTVALCLLMSSCGGGNSAQNDTTTTTTATANIDKSIGAAYGTMISLNIGKAGLKADMLTEAKVIEAFNAQLAGTPQLNIETATKTMQQQMEAIGKGNALPLSEEQKTTFSQAIGTLLGDNMNSMPDKKEINPNDFILSFCKGMKGELVMPAEEAQKIVVAQAQKNGPTQQNPEQKAAQEKAGKDFLAQNKDKKGVITTASGLQYEVLTAGKGENPTINSKVKVHYHGTLIDGSVFDSSVERGEPISFPLNGVIKGWQEGVQLMSKGAKFRFYIPHELGYGGSAAGKIPPFSTLIFDVELFNIES
jgi:FKBP-type peptidyl-prolyl cis-trans isomerase